MKERSDELSRRIYEGIGLDIPLDIAGPGIQLVIPNPYREENDPSITTTMMTIDEVIEKYSDILTEEQIKELTKDD